MSTRAQGPVAGPVEAGWEALGRAEWAEARASFEEAVRREPAGEALEGLSWAGWWVSDAEATFEARERAYNAYRSEGDVRAAARMATWLGTDHVDFHGELAVGQGWLARARRLLEELEPGMEHGWLWIHEAEKHLLAGEARRALESGREATALARSLGDTGLELMGLATEGLALVSLGEVRAGMSKLDEATAGALGSDLGEMWPTGWCCCYMIYACELVRDYDRAAQWCRQLEQWSERRAIAFTARTCRAHYAGVLVWRGIWTEAEAELLESAQRLGELRPPLAAEATVRLAELRRRQGRLDDAERTFEEVEDHPLALLGLAEVCLDRGDPAGARDRAEQFLRDTPEDAHAVRAPALELLLRARAALGEGDGGAQLDELTTVAERVGTEPLRASAALAAGALAAAAGDHDRARTAFEDATRLFHRSGAPYEAARCRLELARALAALGRTSDARREATATEVSLRRIGARLEAERAAALSADLGGPHPRRGPLTGREREVLRLVADGLGDRAIAERLVLSEHTVHRHVANILAKLGCSSRAAAVASALKDDLL